MIEKILAAQKNWVIMGKFYAQPIYTKTLTQGLNLLLWVHLRQVTFQIAQASIDMRSYKRWSSVVYIGTTFKYKFLRVCTQPALLLSKIPYYICVKGGKRLNAGCCVTRQSQCHRKIRKIWNSNLVANIIWMCRSCLQTFLSKRAAFWHRDLLGARVVCFCLSAWPCKWVLSFFPYISYMYVRFSSLFLAGARLTRFGYYIGGKITCKIAFSLYAETRRARRESKRRMGMVFSRMDWIMVKRIYYKADG